MGLQLFYLFIFNFSLVYVFVCVFATSPRSVFVPRFRRPQMCFLPCRCCFYLCLCNDIRWNTPFRNTNLQPICCLFIQTQRIFVAAFIWGQRQTTFFVCVAFETFFLRPTNVAQKSYHFEWERSSDCLYTSPPPHPLPLTPLVAWDLAVCFKNNSNSWMHL